MPFRPGARTTRAWLPLALAALAVGLASLPRSGASVSAAGLIAELSVADAANAADWSIQPALAAGLPQYGDRAYALRSVPESLQGAEWIRTANDSKAFAGDVLARFTLTAAANVYVAFNTSIDARPAWLGSGWTDTGATLVNDEGAPKVFALLKRSFAAGDSVTLGGNGGGSAGMYTVVVATPSVTPPPDPAQRPVLPPKWAFGVLFGSYYDQALVLDAMSRLRDGYGGDLMWVDSSWLSSEYNDPPKYIRFRFDAQQFPDPRRMIATLRANHFHFGLWQWPFVDVSITDLYEHGRRNGYFIRNPAGEVVDGGGWHGVTFTGQFDFTNPGARDWWKALNQPLVEMGVEFFKIDTHSTVPAGGRLFDGTTSTDTLRRLYHQTVFEVSQSASGGRGFILTHRPPSSDNLLYPGMWTGDTRASWAGFEEEMGRAAQMNTSRSAAFWGGDTGGYNSNPSDELYVRWLQYGAFTPINEFFASKGSKTRFPWKFGEQAQQIFKAYMRLRYRLLPFRYSNAQIAHHETPIRWPVRFVDGRSDELIVGSGDSELLVAPIHAQGAVSGEAHLPAGSDWIDYWTGALHAGGTVPTVAAPLERVPLFVKVGSIIPMGPDLEWVDQKPADPLTLDIYPSGRSSYTLYEDDGVSNEYLSGAFARTTFTCDQGRGRLQVTIGPAVGDYAGKLAARTYLLKVNGHRADPNAVTRDGAALPHRASLAALMAAPAGWFHDVAANVLWVKLQVDTGKGAALSL